MKKFIVIPLIAMMAIPFTVNAGEYGQQEEEVIEAEEYDDSFLSDEEIERERALEQERMEEEERLYEDRMEDESMEEEEFYGEEGKTRTERSRDAINTVPDYED